MKKITIVLTAIVMLFATSSFAYDGTTINSAIKTAFQKNFINATNVKWEKNSDFFLAYFDLNEKSITALYNENGELMATSRVIEESQMPLSISLAVAQKYSGYQLSSDVTELSFEGQTNYYFIIKNEKRVLKLKCNANGEISVEHKIKK